MQYSAAPCYHAILSRIDVNILHPIRAILATTYITMPIYFIRNCTVLRTRIEGIQGSEHIGHMHSTYGIFWVESKKSLPQVGRITYIDTHHTSYIYIPHSSIMFGTEVLLYTALHYCCMSSILYGGLGPTVYHSIS